MLFKEVIGQDEVKQLLRAEVDGDRLPHALLLAGDTGYGTMALALALANYVLCRDHTAEGDSCGQCPRCVKVNKLVHPDLHFSFPLIKTGSGVTTCDTYMALWTEFLRGDKYFGLSDWTERMGDQKKMALIPDDEADNIIRKLSLTSYEGGWKIMIIWLPEKMNASAANTMLKTLEEPSERTLFILCSEHPEELLTTILSRTQRIDVPPIPTTLLSQALTERRGLSAETAINVARTSGGSYLKALRQLCNDDNSTAMLDNFMTLMRKAYSKDLASLMGWSDHMAQMTREQQKAYLQYMQDMLRENFMYNFGHSELNFMTPRELQFASKFARFINERNVKPFCDEFSRAQRDVSGNVSGKTIFFNLALQTMILLRQ